MALEQVCTTPRRGVEADARVAARDARFKLRDELHGLSSVKRVRKCTRHRRPGAEGVTLRTNAAGAASFGDVQVCGSVWACPPCSARIRERRAVELEAGILGWLAAGHGGVFVTLTLPHDAGDRLVASLSAVTKGWQRLTSGRAWVDLKAAEGIRGYVRVVEVTHGDSGWHPHLHVVLFTDGVMDDAAAERIRAALYTRWNKWVRKQGFREPSVARGVHVRPVVAGGPALARYLSKVQDQHGDTRWSVARELTRGDVKRTRGSKNKTPLELLEAAVFAVQMSGGDLSFMAPWWEYEDATRGKKCLTWSVGMRRLLALGVEVEDEDLAASDAADTVQHTFTEADWARVLRFRVRHTVLSEFERAGLPAVLALLEALAARPVAVARDYSPPGAPDVEKPDAARSLIARVRGLAEKFSAK